MALLLICADLSPSSSAQQPGSFSLAPVPEDVAQLPLLPIPHSLWLPCCSPAASSLLEGQLASYAHKIFGLDLSPHASSSFPYSPFGLFWSSLLLTPQAKFCILLAAHFQTQAPCSKYYFS